MASAAVDIDSLCEDLGVLLPDGGSLGGAAGSGTEDAGGPGAGAADGVDRPKWTPLVLLKPPGLDTLIDIIKPPIQVIQALLQVISAFLKALSAILVGLLDPYRALVLAVYELLRDLLEDLINTGAYFYFDLPGMSSLEAARQEFGLPTSLKTEWRHGQQGVERPRPAPDGFARWADRFTASFDDPGDPERPILSDGATVTALFIVGAAPTFHAIRQLVHQLGRLFQIQPFVDAADRYMDKSPDPDRAQAAMDPVAPDWHSIRLKDILPPIKKILVLPRMLRSLLLKVDGIQQMLSDMAGVLQKKIEILDEIIKSIQAILDILDALRAMGLHILPVFTTEGPEGLKRAFLEAEDRPEGGFVGGMCLLAGGPGVADATVLFNLFTSDAAVEATKAAWEQTKKDATEKWEQAGVQKAAESLEETAEKAREDLQTAVDNAGDKLAADFGRPVTELRELAETDPAEITAFLGSAKEHLSGEVKSAVERAETALERGKHEGFQAIAAGLGATSGRPDPIEPAAPAKKAKKP